MMTPNSYIDSYPSTVYASPTQNHFPTTFVPSAVDEDTRLPIHVKMEYLRNENPLNSFGSGGSVNSSQIRQTRSIDSVMHRSNDSPNLYMRNDNQTHNMSFKTPSEMGLVNHVDNTKGLNAARSREDGVIGPATDGPAVIIPEVAMDRSSGTAHVIPGDTPDDYSALFIK